MKRTRSQVGKFSKAKGSGYERKIAKILKKWWGAPLRRIYTGEEKIYSGDIVDEKGEFPFIVECKKNEEWSFGNLLEVTENDKTLWGFWRQALGNWLEADPHHHENDPPLLVFSRSFGPDYFMARLQDIQDIGQFCGAWMVQALLVAPPWIGAERIMVGKLKDFLEWSDSEMLRTIPRFRRKE